MEVGPVDKLMVLATLETTLGRTALSSFLAEVLDVLLEGGFDPDLEDPPGAESISSWESLVGVQERLRSGFLLLADFLSSGGEWDLLGRDFWSTRTAICGIFKQVKTKQSQNILILA